jgi:hypothetical protein
MINAPFEMTHDDNNPLDMVEEVLQSRGWKFTREDEEFIAIQMKGQKHTYDICMEWQDEFCALLFSCTLPIEVAQENYEMATRTLEQINQNIWLGHFDLSTKGRLPTFRHTLLLKMIPAGIAVDIVNDLFEIALAECDRFYTTFQLIQAGDVRLQDNLHAAIFETVGEA